MPEFLFVVIIFQNCGKRFLRNIDRAELSHALLPLFLLFQQFFLMGYISTVAFCDYIFAICAHCGASDDFLSDRCLYRNLELMHGDNILEFFADEAPSMICIRFMHDHRERIHHFFVEQDIQFNQFRLFVA